MPGNVPPVRDERDEQARLTPTAGSLSIGGLVKHLARTERGWVATMLQRPSPRSDQEYLDSFRLGPDETLADALEGYDRVARQTEAEVLAIDDLGRAVPVPRGVPWFPQDVEAWSVRWVLLHLIEETARHAGHADLVRESIDGATAFPLMAAAEDWPPSPWMRPWTPPAPSAG